MNNKKLLLIACRGNHKLARYLTKKGFYVFTNPRSKHYLEDHTEIYQEQSFLHDRIGDVLYSTYSKDYSNLAPSFPRQVPQLYLIQLLDHIINIPPEELPLIIAKNQPLYTQETYYHRKGLYQVYPRGLSQLALDLLEYQQ